MKFGSLFSGIGGFDLGFEQTGMECAWQCEIDKAARSVLATHWPGVPCYEDIRDVGRRNTPAVDLICGGFPCQDLSVAGKRAGLAGERSGLYWQMRRVVRELKPQWVVIENVPGLLSSNGGNDFAVVVRGLAKCGYRLAWRVLDAQYAGVAQRRRRVFIVGSLGDGRSAEVLFERDGVFGHPPARQAAGQGVAGTIAAGAHPGGFNGRDVDAGNVVIAKPLGSHNQRQDLDNDTYIVDEPISFDWQTSGSERTYIHDLPERTRNLSASKTLAIAYGGSGRTDFESEALVFEPRYARNGRGAPDTIAPPLKAQNGGTGKGDGAPVVAYSIKTAQTMSNGWGVNEEVMNTLDSANGFAVAFTQNTRDEVRQIGGDGQIAGALGAETGMHQTNYVAFQSSQEGDTDASTQETDARALLRVLRQAIGSEAFTKWGLGILDTLQQAQILRPFVYGSSLRQSEGDKQSQLVNGALSLSKVDTIWPMREVWRIECQRRASQGWQPSEQFTRELGAYLSELSQPGAQQTQALRDLWQASEGIRVLRETLSAFQEMGRPFEGQAQSVRANHGVRRLTPIEASRLQGFPDEWNSYGMTPDGKLVPQSDSARYRQLGNAVAVPVARWIGERIMHHD